MSRRRSVTGRLYEGARPARTELAVLAAILAFATTVQTRSFYHACDGQTLTASSATSCAFAKPHPIRAVAQDASRWYIGEYPLPLVNPARRRRETITNEGAMRAPPSSSGLSQPSDPAARQA
jgi:hypothetical protein